MGKRCVFGRKRVARNARIHVWYRCINMPRGSGVTIIECVRRYADKSFVSRQQFQGERERGGGEAKLEKALHVEYTNKRETQSGKLFEASHAADDQNSQAKYLAHYKSNTLTRNCLLEANKRTNNHFSFQKVKNFKPHFIILCEQIISFVNYFLKYFFK